MRLSPLFKAGNPSDYKILVIAAITHLRRRISHVNLACPVALEDGTGLILSNILSLRPPWPLRENFFLNQ